MHRAHEAKIFEYELHEALRTPSTTHSGIYSGIHKARKHQGQKAVRACKWVGHSI